VTAVYLHTVLLGLFHLTAVQGWIYQNRYQIKFSDVWYDVLLL